MQFTLEFWRSGIVVLHNKSYKTQEISKCHYKTQESGGTLNPVHPTCLRLRTVDVEQY